MIFSRFDVVQWIVSGETVFQMSAVHFHIYNY